MTTSAATTTRISPNDLFLNATKTGMREADSATPNVYDRHAQRPYACMTTKRAET
jgi:hypothetical protein